MAAKRELALGNVDAPALVTHKCGEIFDFLCSSIESNPPPPPSLLRRYEDTLHRVNLMSIHYKYYDFISDLAYINKMTNKNRSFSVRQSRASMIERGNLLISKTFFLTSKLSLLPSSLSQVSSKLDSLADRVRRITTLSSSTIDVIKALNTVLFNDFGLRGNDGNYYDVRNSLLDHVLERKLGIPMSLAVVYCIVASRVGVDIDIIGLPGHIICAAGAKGDRTYFDVFHNDRSLLDLSDIVNIVNSYGLIFQTSMLQPLKPNDVCLRVLRNIANCIFGSHQPISPDNASSPYIKNPLYGKSAQYLIRIHTDAPFIA